MRFIPIASRFNWLNAASAVDLLAALARSESQNLFELKAE